jgi:CRISPR-associated protein Cas8a1/Csx13
VTTLHLELSAPGMTPMHSAGLGGLATSLLALERGGARVEGLEWDVGRRHIDLTFADSDAHALVRLVEASMTCADGLIVFRCFDDLPEYTLEAKLVMNECLLGTLLQHNKMLKPDGARKAERTIEIDGRQILFRVKKLTNFVHRFAAKDLVTEGGSLATGGMEIKGWAIPGAVKRHEKAPHTAMTEHAERFLPLLFAPIGSVPFRLSAAIRRAKLDYALVVPDVDDLRDFAKVRRALVGGALSMRASSAGDAALTFYARLHALGLLRKLRVRQCTVLGLGTVVWASQQKTRTQILTLEPPSDVLLERIDLVHQFLPARIRAQSEGSGGFVDVPAWRQLAAENLAASRPLWSGLGDALHDKDLRKKLLSYEQALVKELVKAMMKKDLLGTERQQRFVEACHEAIRRRYAMVHDRISREGLDSRAVFDREREQMRTSLGRCKNVATFRAAVVDLWARGGRNAPLQVHWRTMLEFFGEETWQLGRDLALLALASYASREQPNEAVDEEVVA